MSRNSEKIERITILAILTAIVIVLQIICTFVKFGPFSITLALAPIIIGAALYGARAGMYLGGVLGAVVLITGFFGWDGGTVMILMGLNAPATIALCLVKSALAGFLAGLVYKLLRGRSVLGGVIAAGIVSPVTNTGLFIAGMLAFFAPTLASWADGAGQKLTYYVIFTLTGANFLLELFVNMVLAAAITRVIRAKKHVAPKY